MLTVNSCTIYYDTMTIICHFRDCKAYLDPRVGHIMKCLATFAFVDSFL